jgi:hypothetical protein
MVKLKSPYGHYEGMWMGGGIGSRILNLGTIWWRVVSFTLLPLEPRKEPLVLIGEKAGWAPAPVWTATENLATTGIRSPNHPARSKCSFYSMYIIYGAWGGVVVKALRY